MRRFRIAHLSDIHLGPVPSPAIGALISKRVFGYVNWKRNRAGALGSRILDAAVADIAAQGADHVCVSGDLTNISLDDEFENARRWLARLGAPDEVSVVPGNHDAYVPGAARRALAAWAPYAAGDSGRAGFPYLRRRGEVAIIGISSAVATPPFSARGRVGTEQLKRLAAMLDRADDAHKVVMVHHPPLYAAAPFRRRLADANHLCDVLAEGAADIVLHGHNHAPSLDFLETVRGSAAIVGVPSASSDGTKHPAGGYALIDIDAVAGTASMIRRVWDRLAGDFVPEPATPLSPLRSDN
ncbi:MAG: metallophosphoesterase [Pseudomonadota bacterium]